jgi:hypothetical protein
MGVALVSCYKSRCKFDVQIIPACGNYPGKECTVNRTFLPETKI